MLSAPASTATMVATYPAAFAPLSAGRLTRCATASYRPACWARRITGTRPARHQIRIVERRACHNVLPPRAPVYMLSRFRAGMGVE